MLESHFLPEDLSLMSDANARQKAEDHYYAALDLVAEGEQERALADIRSLSPPTRPSPKPCTAWPGPCKT